MLGSALRLRAYGSARDGHRLGPHEIINDLQFSHAVKERSGTLRTYKWASLCEGVTAAGARGG